MTTDRGLPAGVDVESWNDRLAREHDIDDYYTRSNPIIRYIERRRLETIRELAQPVRSERLLEIGCGGGHVLRMFPECRLVGVDVSGEMLAKAKKNLAGFDVELHKGELASLGLEERSFDVIVCTEVLEHVVDPDAILDSIARLAKPGGRVVITFPNDELINGVKGAVVRLGISRLPPFSSMSWGGDDFHLHVWSIAEMRTLLARRFRVEVERHVPSAVFPVRCCFRVRA